MYQLSPANMTALCSQLADKLQALDNPSWMALAWRFPFGAITGPSAHPALHRAFRDIVDRCVHILQAVMSEMDTSGSDINALSGALVCE